MPHLCRERSSQGAPGLRIHVRVVCDDDGAGMQFGPNRLELECEVSGGPRAVVTVEVDRGQLLEKAGQNILAPSLSQVPVALQPGGNRPAGVLAARNAPRELSSGPLFSLLRRRQISRMELTAAVPLEAHQDVRG